jgi:hypothetical protein
MILPKLLTKTRRSEPMAYHTTILRQIIDIFPRHEFESLARDYHVGQKFRSFNRWTQFMVLLIGQLSGRKSLRDLVMNVSAQTSKLYHLAIKPCSRATLARVNEKHLPIFTRNAGKSNSSSNGSSRI